MSALTKERVTRVKKSGGMDFPVAANKKIFKGAFVVLAAGMLEPATIGADLRPVGRASANVDNTGGADGAVTCHVDFMREKTLFPLIGDSANLFHASDIGAVAYLLDDQTVTPIATGHSPAGVVWRLEQPNSVQTVWIEV